MSSYGGRGPTLNAVLWTEVVVASVFVGSRIYARKIVLQSVGWDDFFLLGTLIFLIVYAILLSVGTAHGIGQLRGDIDVADYTQAMKYELISQGVCIFNIAISKAAVAFFLLRIVRKTYQRVFIWGCVVSTTLLVTWCTIAVFIQCIPMESIWNPMVKGNCWLDFTTVGIVTSAYAVVIDFTLAISPCFVVWSLNMKRKDKLLTISGLSLGVFAGLCGILRTTSLTSLASFDEYIYDTVPMLIYSGTENFVSVICASIPVLRPLWNRMLNRTGSGSDSRPFRSYEMDRMSNDPERMLGGKEMGGRGILETKSFTTKVDSTARPDNASDESILRDTWEHNRKTGTAVYRTEISANNSERSANFQRP